MSKLKRKHYEALLEPLQAELVAMARWLQHSGRRAVVLFEGRDTACPIRTSLTANWHSPHWPASLPVNATAC